ncbi:MAG: DUF1573 domain-containing protein [Capnocytophaga sp.]|jgi:hypothetical protein|uniref:DUF1573 domain-containing protein n=1 Tax=Capnocytophaga sp. oral taxon 863 TaxID=1227265 RepID=UPI000396DBE3|nr:DUF1573 domain-containing protein [Capnocytophaga sp. oral taxon 863]ERI62378.1 hypothetical protein HMPREF1551_01929 [Capnocytophaga sp. oral taxon 863 str. F0517]RKW10419.1 MAG: DUF1573 domain-containing protein [Capnocytophaga sp.]
MKRIFLLATVALVASCGHSGTDAAGRIQQSNLEAAEKLAEQATQFPQIKFEETTHDFGEIKQNVEVQTLFQFKNTGKVPLVITNASSSCGCTVPEYPKEAIAPGESGAIKVVYNGSGKDAITKTVTLTTNTEQGSEMLTIKAFVKE